MAATLVHKYMKPSRALTRICGPAPLQRKGTRVELWLKEIAPSTELRKFFWHDPAKWKEFSSATAPNSKRTQRRWNCFGPL
jgi:uncharacterized protein YeaO (DUF488 family)